MKSYISNVVSKSVKLLLTVLTRYAKPKRAIRNQRVYLIGSEDWGNLGDHHIAISELDYLAKNFDDIVEITASEYFSRRNWLMRHITQNDIIFLTGGGNIGNVYEFAGKIRRDVIQTWPNNIKCILPQTSYYTKDNEGEGALKADVALMTSEKNVVIVARERESYDFLKENFNCTVLLTPDIVLSSKYSSTFETRKDIGLLCTRHDIERSLTDDMHIALKEVLEKFVNSVEFIDTQKEEQITKEQRMGEILRFISKIQSSRIVITDRLHGMVFCAITGTPCIVFENYNHKVRGTYQWIKDLPYIRLVKTIDEVYEVLNTDFWKKEYQYVNEKILSMYSIIIEELEKLYLGDCY